MDVLDVDLKLWFDFLVVSLLIQQADLVKGVAMNPFLNILLRLLGPRIHLIDSIPISLPPFPEQLLDHLRAHLLSDDLIDLLIMEEGDFPVLITKALWKVFKIGCLVPLNIIQSDQVAFLIWYLIHQNLAENMLHRWGPLLINSWQVLAQVFVVDDIHKVDHQVFQS